MNRTSALGRTFGVIVLTGSACLAQQPRTEPTRRALLVGINNYKHAGGDLVNLNGAAGDAGWLKTILVSKFGFADQNVIVLKDQDATRKNIIDTFRTHLIRNSKSGDVAVFYYAGHGTQRHAKATAGSPRRLVETAILPYDARDRGVFDITQSELHTLFADLVHNTTNVTAIIDACFSSTTLRGDAVIRFAPPDTRERPPDSFLQNIYPPEVPDVQSRGLEGKASPVDRVVRISAAGADQFSNEFEEVTREGAKIQHGAMSYYLFRELAAANERTTWRDAMDATRDRVNAMYNTQMPDIQPPDRQDELLFGGAGPKAKEMFFTVERDGKRVKLHAGSIHAISTGTQLDVYPPAELEFAGTPVAKISVASVNDTWSAADLVSGEVRQIQPDSRAVIRFRPPSSFHFRIFFDGSDPLITSIQKSALAVPDAQAEGARITADAVVRVAEGLIRIEHPDGSIMSDPIRADDADAQQKAVAQLKTWAAWRRNLDAQGADPLLKLKIRDRQDKPLPQTITSGTKFVLSLCNTGKAPYYARIFIFASDGTASEFTVTQGFDLWGKPIPPSESCVSASGKLELDMSPPRGRKSGVEYVKVYATTQPVDLDFLSESNARGDATWSADTVALRISDR
jgi:hypothetical protein